MKVRAAEPWNGTVLRAVVENPGSPIRVWKYQVRSLSSRLIPLITSVSSSGSGRCRQLRIENNHH